MAIMSTPDRLFNVADEIAATHTKPALFESQSSFTARRIKLRAAIYIALLDTRTENGGDQP